MGHGWCWDAWSPRQSLPLTDQAFAVQRGRKAIPLQPFYRCRVSKECRWGSAKFGVSEGQRKPQGCSRHLEIRPRGTRSLHPACPPYLRPTLKWHLPHDRLCKKHLPPHQVTADINLCSGKRSRLLARALIQPTQNCKEVRICAGPRQGVFIWRMYSKQLGFECWTLTNKSQTKIYSQRLLSGCFW